MTTPFEADPADVAEQDAPAVPDAEPEAAASPGVLLPEVPEADAAEQAVPVTDDEDDRR